MSRRVLGIAAGALVAAFVVGLIGWAWWLPQYRPAVSADETFGVDVSNHQGDIDWNQVAGDDITFAYIKATEGGDFVDTFFADNWAEAKAAGIEAGAYHFFTLCTPGAEQAANVLDIVPIDDMDLPLALDLEFGGNCASRPSSEWIQQEVEVFIDTVEAATGEEVILYVSEKFEARYGTKEQVDRELWERRLWRRPQVDTWTYWQWTNRGKVDGIEGGVDINVGRPTPS